MAIEQTSILDLASKFLMPLVLIVITWQYNELEQLDERVFQLQRESVTEQKLSDTEKRLTTYMEVRINDLTQKQDVANKYLELIVQSIKTGK